VEYKKESFGMFEAMMLHFQEDTVRHLFRMQILAPNGTPIETLEQLAALQSAHPAPSLPPQQQRLPMGVVPPGAASPNGHQSAPQMPPPVIPTRPPSTTIDALEREFQRNKQRDLDAARMASSSGKNGAPAATQRRTGQEVGRNDPCFCGSGKKYKKCHGAAA
jgi:preprotein translocase subunit SecA